jgi:rod shape-determining protein MreC
MLGFLRRYRILFTSSACLLASLLLVSMSGRARGSLSEPVAEVLLDGLAPLQAAVTWLQVKLEGLWDGYVNVVRVGRENQELRERVALLEQQTVRLGELAGENERLTRLLDLRARVAGVAYSARVIGRDPLPWFRTLTVDRGERDGIRRGMAVLAPHGVVGQIARVSYTAAQVLVLTDNNSGIDALVQRSRARGIVQGDLDAGCHMKYLRRTEDVAVGDHVITSGLDGIFPKGVMIGRVVEVALRNRGLLQVAVIEPSVALDRLEEVLIVDAIAELREGGS